MRPSFSHLRARIFLLILCLCAIASTSAQQTAAAPQHLENPCNAKLIRLQSQWNASSPSARAVLLNHAFALRDFVDAPASVAGFMERVAADSREHPLVRAEANFYIAQISIQTGDLTRARARYADLAFVGEWSLLGPVSSSSDLTSAIASNPGTAWKTISATGAQPWIDLAAQQRTSVPATAFLSASIYSDREQTVALHFASETAATLFVNGVQIAALSSANNVALDQNGAGANLVAGWNSLVVKLAHNDEPQWRFGLRITTPDGQPLALQSKPSGVESLPQADGEASQIAVSDLFAEALRDVTQHPASASAMDTLAELKRIHARGSYFDALEVAERTAPTADRWFAMAQACGDVTCKYAALTSALKVDPNFGDAKVALAQYYLSRRQFEKAIDLLSSAVQSNHDDFVARERLAEVYSAAGNSQDALRELRKLQADFPAPIWLRREIALKYAELGREDESLSLLRSLQTDCFGDERAHAAMLGILQHREQSAELLAFQQQWLQLHPEDVSARLQLAQIEAGSGQTDAALRELQSIVSTAPEVQSAHQLLANLLLASGRAEDAHREMARAAELAPLPFRFDTKSAATTTADEDAAYLADVNQLMRSVRDKAPQANGNVLSLVDVTVERMRENGQTSVRTQQVFYIASERGAHDYATRSVQYSGLTQQLQILAARVHKRDGRVLEADDTGENGVADTSTQMYYDSRVHVLRFPNLQKGDLVELDYRISPSSEVNPYGSYFGTLVTFRNGLEQRLKRYVLIAPVDRKLNVVEDRMPAAASIKEEGDRRIYKWEAQNMAALPSEPRGPALTEVAPYVNVSTFATWQDLGRWYAKLIEPQFNLDESLRAVVSRIATSSTSEVDRIRAIHEFVLRNTHYVALEFGIYSYKPYPVSQVYARRFGDCKDKASLMISLLRAAGVDADIALVRTNKLGIVGENATALQVFDHAIVYIPRYDMWLDGTAEYAGSRELPLDDQGAMALTVSLDGDAQLRRIPVTLPLQNYTHRVVHAELLADGNIRFTGSAYTRGEDAPGLRREFETPERQRDSLRNNLAQVYPSVRIDDVKVDGAHDLERDINMNFRGALDTFAGRHVFSLVSSWLPHQYVNSLAPMSQRSQDLRLPAPWTTEEELHISLPEGGRFEAIPKNIILTSRFGSAVLKYEMRGRELVVTTSVQFRQLRITPAEYVGFRDFCRQAEQAFHTEIKVRLMDDRLAESAVPSRPGMAQ